MAYINTYVNSSLLIGFFIVLIYGPLLTAHYGRILCSNNGALVKNEIRHKYLFISLLFLVTQILLSNKKMSCIIYFFHVRYESHEIADNTSE